MPLLALTPSDLFMYCFVPLGAAAVAIGLFRAARRPQPIKPWGALMLGGLLLGGTGGFGPSFLGSYADFLTKVAQLDPDSSEAKQAVEKIAGDLATGGVPDSAKALAETVLAQTDVPDAQSIIDRSLEKADETGRTSLGAVKKSLDRRARLAVVEAVEQPAGGAAALPPRVPPTVDLERLPPQTLRDLNTRSARELETLGIDPSKLRAAARKVTPPPVHH